MKALTGYTANCLHIVEDFANNLKLKRFEKSCIDLKQKTEKMYTTDCKISTTNSCATNALRKTLGLRSYGNNFYRPLNSLPYFIKTIKEKIFKTDQTFFAQHYQSKTLRR